MTGEEEKEERECKQSEARSADKSRVAIWLPREVNKDTCSFFLYFDQLH